MKKLVTIAAVAALFSGFALVDNADAGNKYKYKYKYQNKFGSKFKHNNNFRPRYPRVKYNLPFGGKIVAPAFYPAPPVIIAPPPVVPAFTFVFDQVWIEPVYNQIISGYDSCGNPIYQQVMSQAGHFRTAKYQLYPSGRRIFIGYV